MRPVTAAPGAACLRIAAARAVSAAAAGNDGDEEKEVELELPPQTTASRIAPSPKRRRSDSSPQKPRKAVAAAPESAAGPMSALREKAEGLARPASVSVTKAEEEEEAKTGAAEGPSRGCDLGLAVARGTARISVTLPPKATRAIDSTRDSWAAKEGQSPERGAAEAEEEAAEEGAIGGGSGGGQGGRASRLLLLAAPDTSEEAGEY